MNNKNKWNNDFTNILVFYSTRFIIYLVLTYTHIFAFISSNINKVTTK